MVYHAWFVTMNHLPNYTMRPINKKLFIEKAQQVMTELQKPEPKAES